MDIKMKRNRKLQIMVIVGLTVIIGMLFLLRGALRIIAMEIVYFSRGDIPEITVDFNDITGEMRPLHGINNGPKSGYSEVDQGTGNWQLDMTEVYELVNIPFVRIHDTEYPYGQDKFVDIHCIFPDMDQNVNDPSAYCFEETDEYISAIINSGAQVFFRLGESIDHSGEDRYIHPPEDYMKWAQVCEHIIRHYNEGWADGFYYNIVYWEIWNEPDHKSMWTGSMEQYYELYRVTARYLKSMFPEIKIGGCALASVSEESLLQFLQSLDIDGQKTPLDFFSWHLYTSNPERIGEWADLVRRVLDENGYENTESILDEWNYIKNWDDLSGAAEVINSWEGAAYMAASLITMQKSPVDLAMYYDGQYVLADIFCGLYDSKGQIEPGYYAFSFYNQLCLLGQQVRMEEGLEQFYCCAASDQNEGGILLANFDSKAVTIKLRINSGGENALITRVNEKYEDGIVSEEKRFFNRVVLKIEAGETLYIELN